jgi:hypothetical protein
MRNLRIACIAHVLQYSWENLNSIIKRGNEVTFSLSYTRSLYSTRPSLSHHILFRSIFSLKGGYFFKYFFSTLFNNASSAPSDSSVSEYAGIEPRTVATSAMAGDLFWWTVLLKIRKTETFLYHHKLCPGIHQCWGSVTFGADPDPLIHTSDQRSGLGSGSGSCYFHQ